MPASGLKTEIARLLRDEGYIKGYRIDKGESFETIEGRPGAAGERIVVRLKYTENRTSVISGIRRVSRPGQRTYVDAKHVPKVLGGMGTAILSTSHGVMTGHDARKAGVGGEVVAEVW